MMLASVMADIPVHCLRDDFAGQWTIKLGNPVNDGDSSDEVPDFVKGGLKHDYCFAGHPNKNSMNIKLSNHPNREMENPHRVIDMNLTLGRYLSNDLSQHLVAQSSEYQGQSSWTTVYDEGWEANLHTENKDEKLHLFAFAHYKCADPTDSACGLDGVGEDSEGQTAGYKSQCGETLLGWYDMGNGAKGCFYGAKVDDKEKTHAIVVSEGEKHHSTMMQLHTAYHARDFPNEIPAYPSVLEMHKGGRASNFVKVRRSGSIKKYDKTHTMHLRDECAADEVLNKGSVTKMEEVDRKSVV